MEPWWIYENASIHFTGCQALPALLAAFKTRKCSESATLALCVAISEHLLILDLVYKKLCHLWMIPPESPGVRTSERVENTSSATTSCKIILHWHQYGTKRMMMVFWSFWKNTAQSPCVWWRIMDSGTMMIWFIVWWFLPWWYHDDIGYCMILILYDDTMMIMGFHFIYFISGRTSSCWS